MECVFRCNWKCLVDELRIRLTIPYLAHEKKPLSLLLHRNCNRSVWRKRCNSSRKKKIVDFHGSVVYVCRSLSIVLFRLSLLLLLLRCFFLYFLGGIFFICYLPSQKPPCFFLFIGGLEMTMPSALQCTMQKPSRC